MFYKLRNKDGGVSDSSIGTFINKDGTYEPIFHRDIQIDVHDEWKSKKTGITYPSAWTITLYRKNLELNVVPMILNQELNLTVNYWEGAVRITGRTLRGNDNLLDGYGYIELAGYEKSSS
jgi:predicted secreted hydrolase